MTHRKHTASVEDYAFLQSFLDCTLEAEKFHHEQHLRIAYTVLVDCDVDDAMAIIKQGILNLLNHLGVGPDKYHETITFSWLLLVRAAMARSESCCRFDDIIRMNDDLRQTTLIENFYSAELLASAHARNSLVKPDLKPIAGNR